MTSLSRRRMLSGTAAGVAAAFTQSGCAVSGEATARNPPIAAFMELSAVLTGLYTIVEASEQQAVNRDLAQEYWRRLFSHFPVGLPRLVEAYQRVNPATSKKPHGDAVLARLRETDEFKRHAFVTRQIISIWYISQFSTDEERPKEPAADGGRFERGMVWPLIGAHPPGFTDQPYGHWAFKPAREAP